MLSQANKPWFIASRDPSSLLDEMKGINLNMWKEGNEDNQQLDKDVLY